MRRVYAVVAFAVLALVACSAQNNSLTPFSTQTSLGREHRGVPRAIKPHVFHSRDWFKVHPRPHGLRPNNLNPLTYHNGAIEVHPKIYLIFWGISSSSDTTHDPDGEAQYLIDFFTAMGGSSWINSDTQYYQNMSGTSYIGNPSTQYLGNMFDSTLPNATYTDAQVQTEAKKLVTHFGYDTDANYIVVTGHNKTISGFKTNFCGYHSVAYAGAGSTKPFSYTILPYQPDAGQSCGAQSVTSSVLDGASIVGGHEEGETQTDPGAGDGWIDLNDSSGGENGDKCAWTNLKNTLFPNGKKFPTQPLYSNATHSCVQSYSGGGTPAPSATPSTGPTPSSGGSMTPSPSPSPTPTPTNVVVNPGFESGLKPWGSCRSSSTMPVATVSSSQWHSGSHAGYAAFAIEKVGITSICQQVHVTPGAMLTFWTKGVSNDHVGSTTNEFQFATLYKLSGSAAKTYYKANTNDSGWKMHAYSVSSTLAGKSYYLAFGVQINAKHSGKKIGLYVDDVSLVELASSPRITPDNQLDLLIKGFTP